MDTTKTDAQKQDDGAKPGLARADGSTPRTEKKCPVTIYDCMGQKYTADLVPADFARQLEREVNQLREALEAIPIEMTSPYFGYRKRILSNGGGETRRQESK